MIIAKLDRLTRSVKDLYTLLEPFENDIAPISVAEALGPGSAAGRLVITIMGAVHQMGARSHRRTHARRIAAQSRQGQRVGNIQFGFRLSTDGRHLEPEAREQAALAEMRRPRTVGLTLRAIAVALNSSGHRTRRGTEWQLESVARVVNQTKRSQTKNA